LLDDGPVASVAGKTGVVTLTADDLTDGSTNAIPTLTQETNWDTAYGWGDHSSAGYLTSVSEAAVTAHQAALTITESQISDLTHFSGAYADLTGKPTIPSTGNFSLSNNTISTNSGDTGIDLAINGATSDDPPALVNKAWRFVNDGSLQFRSPMNIGSEVDATITSTKVGQWDTAYGWGDHSAAGYLTSFTETNDLSASVTWANVPDVNITQSSVTQHQAALTITESQVSDLGSYVESDTTGITGADQVTNIVTLTQAEYDNIGSPNASTVYIIVG
jgi:hypothetical protein